MVEVGYGFVSSSGYGFGSGDGAGFGFGSGAGVDPKWFFTLVAQSLQAEWVLSERNTEIKRKLIEAMGADRLFGQVNVVVAHQDIDGCNNPRQLVRFHLPDTRAGYLQAVRVICPTTGRVYYLGVPPTVKTCQEAVASTFGIKPDGYHPDRES